MHDRCSPLNCNICDDCVSDNHEVASGLTREINSSLEEIHLPHISYTLISLDTAIIFQLGYMDEKFRNKDYLDSISYSSNNNYNIISAIRPQISKNHIFIGGSYKEQDKKVCILPCDSNYTRDRLLGTIKEAIADWDENWEGFKCETLKE